jgi:hypothetical protein
VKFVISAALAAMLAAVPAWAAPGPVPYDPGNGNLQAPTITLGVCGSATITGGTISTFCAPGFQPATTFYNAGGVLTQVSPTNPLPTTGSGGGSGGGSVTQGTSPWVDNVTQFGGVAVSLGSGASDTGTQRVVLGATEPALPLSAGAATSATQASQLAAEQATQAAVQGTLATTGFNRVAITATSTAVSATTSTQVIAANATRKSLQVCGPLATGATFEIGYGAAASATSSIAYGPAGISLCNRWGPADGVPTQAISVYSSVAATFQVEEGN